MAGRLARRARMRDAKARELHFKSAHTCAHCKLSPLFFRQRELARCSDAGCKVGFGSLIFMAAVELLSLLQILGKISAGLRDKEIFSSSWCE